MNVLEIHMIQSVPTSNINRGEDGEPKSVVFGGTQRHRVSSQAWKRPTRLNVQQWCKENGSSHGTLSRTFQNIIKQRCENVAKIDKTIKALGFSDDCLMYLSDEEIDNIVNYINGESELDEKEVKSIVKNSNNQPALDISLFGRMFASNPDLNVYGAVKVSHAISTHSVEIEDDYFTAVDQLNTNGAGHIGHNSFTTSTLYRYYAIDLDQFTQNLKTKNISEYFDLILRSIYLSFPTGKENSFAAYTRPAMFNVTIKKGQPYTYVNAFESPIESNGNGFIEPSIEKFNSFKEQELSYGFDKVLLDMTISSDTPIQTIVSKVSETIDSLYVGE